MRIGARVACLVFGCGQAPLRGQQPESLRLCRISANLFLQYGQEFDTV